MGVSGVGGGSVLSTGCYGGAMSAPSSTNAGVNNGVFTNSGFGGSNFGVSMSHDVGGDAVRTDMITSMGSGVVGGGGALSMGGFGGAMSPPSSTGAGAGAYNGPFTNTSFGGGGGDLL